MVKTTLATVGATVLFALSNAGMAQAEQRTGSMDGSRSHGAMSTHSASGWAHSGSDASALGPGAVGGGVGINARARLSDRAAPDHNVKLVFSLSTGNYVADVDLKVTDRSGKTVIDGVSPGPWLYAKLAAGTYTAQATYMGETVTEKFTVGSSGQRVAHMRWPAKVEMQASAAQVEPILGTGPQEMQR
jgi:hypothetical protein